MNRAERRKKERKQRKEPVQEPVQSFNINYELFRPWADIIMQAKLPPMILDKMIEISDKIIEGEEKTSWGKNLAGQIEQEYLIPHTVLEEHKVFGFFVNMVLEYVFACHVQQATESYRSEIEKMKKDWRIQLKSMWIVEQQPGEYNPVHIHTDCDISSVMYLKVPKFLPSIKPERDDDGCIYFIGDAGVANKLKKGTVKCKPVPGDFFIFPQHMLHTVYPYETEDDFVRRSISFNASFVHVNELTNTFSYASSAGEGEAIGPSATDKVILGDR